MNKIHLLPPTLINQIAAGEVIQRPASVVKELLENAIDAQSQHIKVIIKESGKNLIQVIDDGIGMSPADAKMSLEKHATSKISSSDDLFNIHTLGFRGEALPSISAVSQMVIETRTPQAEVGTCIRIEGGTIQAEKPVSTPQGTKVSIKNLFFNLPARRQFLKSPAVEMKHIIEEFQRVTLANPTVAFSMYHNEQELYHLPATDKLSHRIVALLGNNYREQLIPCQESTDLIQIQGYIGKPKYAKKTRGDQFFLVNGRFIKSPYLHHAVKVGFEGLLAHDAFPFYVLCLSLDPAHIDINVHPTKTEVKFKDERMVHRVLAAAIRQSLSVHHMTPSLDFTGDVNFLPFPTTTPSSTPTVEKEYTRFQVRQDTAADDRDPAPAVCGDPAASYGDKEANAGDIEAIIHEALEAPKWQLHGRYILIPVQPGLLIIDQKLAHERILYERYLRSLAGNSGVSQQLAFPQHITVSLSDAALLAEYQDLFNSLGFRVASLGKGSIVVSGCPAEVVDHDSKGLLEGLLEQVKEDVEGVKLPVEERVARALAKRSCIKWGERLEDKELDNFVARLLGCRYSAYTPDGMQVWGIVRMWELARWMRGDADEKAPYRYHLRSMRVAV
ncbi:MAG: DNA mismatch repair endonuclease MutL [Bacteroidota bacterium]